MSTDAVSPLLNAARDVFNEHETHLTTRELLSRIVRAHPNWTYVSRWTSLTSASMQFASVVAQYGIEAKRFSQNGKQVRGYAKRDFQIALGEEQKSSLPDWV